MLLNSAWSIAQDPQDMNNFNPSKSGIPSKQDKLIHWADLFWKWNKFLLTTAKVKHVRLEDKTKK